MSVTDTLLKINPKWEPAQIQQFERDLIALRVEYNQADIDTINSDDFSKKIVDDFDQMLLKLGYGEFDPDSPGDLIHELYLNSESKSIIEFIVLGYRRLCEDDRILESTYELMLQEMRSGFEDYDE